MPITGPAITGAILAAGPTLTGTLWIQIATATGFAVASWAKIPANVILQGTVAGPVGVGTVQGKYTVAPNAPLVTAAFAAAGLVGPLAPQMASAVALGVANALNASATYQGNSVGAIGADISGVTFTNSATLIQAVTLNLAAGIAFGTISVSYAIGVGNGIAAMVKTGRGVGTATGGAGPFPGSGTSVSKLA